MQIQQGESCQLIKTASPSTLVAYRVGDIMGNAAERIEPKNQSERIVVATDNFGFSAIAYSTLEPHSVVSAASAEEAFHGLMQRRSSDYSTHPPGALLASAIRGDLGMIVELQNVADIR